MNNFGAFTSVLSEFSAGCPATEIICLDMQMQLSRCPRCPGDSTTNKGFSVVGRRGSVVGSTGNLQARNRGFDLRLG